MSDIPQGDVEYKGTTPGKVVTALRNATGRGSRCAFRCSLVCSVLVSLCGSAAAIVGDAELANWLVVRPAVMVASPRGTCSGAILRSDLVLTAAHCLIATSTAKVAGPGSGWIGVKESVPHPQFNAGTARADLALLKLSARLPTGLAPALLGLRSVATDERVIVVGYGLQDEGKRESVARMATLVVSDHRQDTVALADRQAWGERAKRGSCQGDSGGPVFSLRGGIPLLVGVVRGSNHCGGITFVTPLAPYQHWIEDTARQLGSPFGQ
jgi:secreted trypsin-like serine protease